MIGKWMAAKLMTSNIYKIAKKFGKRCIFLNPPCHCTHFIICLETAIVPIFAVVFSVAYWSISTLCYFNYLD